MANKEKQRLKRKEKQRQLRKLANQSPLLALAQRGRVQHCWINEQWKECGLAGMMVEILQPNGMATLAAYVVDIWCMGLKDTFCRMDLAPSEMQEMLDDIPYGTMAPTQFELVRGLVAGGLRFANQNHFRLPADWAKMLKLIGVEESTPADLSGFGKDGKLYYCGDIEDFEDAYLGDAAEFMRRDDVQFILKSDQTGRETDVRQLRDNASDFHRNMETLTQSIAVEVEAWCRGNGEEPSPILGEAIARMGSAMATSALSMAMKPEGKSFDKAVWSRRAQGLLEIFCLNKPADYQQNFERGIKQYTGYCDAHPDRRNVIMEIVTQAVTTLITPSPGGEGLGQ